MSVKDCRKEFIVAYTQNDQQLYKQIRARTEESALYNFLQEYGDYDWISPADTEHKQECYEQ